jgi:hypothetical protein
MKEQGNWATGQQNVEDGMVATEARTAVDQDFLTLRRGSTGSCSNSQRICGEILSVHGNQVRPSQYFKLRVVAQRI